MSVPTTPRADRESGLTMIELLVAMVVFSVLVSAVMSGILVMTRSVTTARQVSDSSAYQRSVTLTLTRSIAAAAMVGAPATANGRTYLEVRIDTRGNGSVPTCVQWRFDPTTRLVEERRWPADGGTATAWRVLARNVVNDPAARPPFTLQAADDVRPLPRVVVDVEIREGTGPRTSGSTAVQVRNHDPGRPTPDCRAMGRP